MDLTFSPDDLQFQERARAWLLANVPKDPAPHDGPEARTYALDWLAKCHADGWSGIGWAAPKSATK